MIGKIWRRPERCRAECEKNRARTRLETYFITIGSLFTSARPAGSCHHELTISRYPIFATVESSPRRSSRADSQNDLLFKRAYTRLYRHVPPSFFPSLCLRPSSFSRAFTKVGNRSTVKILGLLTNGMYYVNWEKNSWWAVFMKITWISSKLL